MVFNLDTKLENLVFFGFNIETPGEFTATCLGFAALAFFNELLKRLRRNILMGTKDWTSYGQPSRYGSTTRRLQTSTIKWVIVASSVTYLCSGLVLLDVHVKRTKLKGFPPLSVLGNTFCRKESLGYICTHVFFHIIAVTTGFRGALLLACTWCKTQWATWQCWRWWHSTSGFYWVSLRAQWPDTTSWCRLLLLGRQQDWPRLEDERL